MSEMKPAQTLPTHPLLELMEFWYRINGKGNTAKDPACQRYVRTNTRLARHEDFSVLKKSGIFQNYLWLLFIIKVMYILGAI